MSGHGNILASMARKPTYEVYLHRDGRWTLETVEQDERAARILGERLAETRKDIGVRVVRSHQAADGSEIEKVLFEKAPPVVRAGPRPAGPQLGELDDVPICETLGAYYDLPSRIAIRRLLWKWLDDVGLIPCELLYNPTEGQKLFDNASLAGAAIERVAAVQGRISGEDPRARRDDINRALKRILARAKTADQAIGTPSGGSLAALVEAATKAAGPNERTNAIGVMLCRPLSQIRAMTGKLARVMGWLNEADEPAVLSLLDGFVADIMGSASVVQDIIGPKSNLGGAMLAMTELVAGTLTTPGRAVADTALALNGHFGAGRLPGSASVLIERIAKNLRSSQQLSRNEPGAELDLFRRIMDAALTPTGVIGGPLMADALVARCGRVMNIGGKSAIVDGTATLAGWAADGARRAHFLIAVHDSETGRLYPNEVLKLIENHFVTMADIGQLAAASLSPRDRLAIITQAHNALEQSRLTERVRKAACANLDKLQADYIVDSRLIDKMDRPADPLRLRATRLLQFYASGILIRGHSQDATRLRVLEHLRTPRFDQAFVEDIADPAEKATKLREFHRLLVRSGLTEPRPSAATAGAGPVTEGFTRMGPPPGRMEGMTAILGPSQVAAAMPVPVAPVVAAAARPASPTMPSDRCVSCFALKGEAAVCPDCGYIAPDQPEPSKYLVPGDCLLQRYFVGRLLGCGGFGATYMGWDEKLHVKVAIKEYYPSSMASRSGDGRTLRPNSDDFSTQYVFGMEKFLDEARILAQFRSVPEIIAVVDFFEENDTAYIVMEYVHGKPLNTYIKEQGGRIGIKDALTLIFPIINALEQVHAKQVIHRDISPDNIYLVPDGTVKLLDFGAARHAVGDKTGSLTVVLKRGYAPAEQYSITSRQGPWTDVYALCATLYRAVTGQMPVEAVSRWEEDLLVPPSKLAPIPPAIDAALVKGLALRAQDRLQNMAELRRALAGR